MRRYLFALVLLLLAPTNLYSRVLKWEGRALSVSISTERLTRVEFSESLRSAFLSRSNISLERDDRSLYLRALFPDTQDTLFVVGETGTTYEINLSTSDKPDDTVLISYAPKSLEAQAASARSVPALDLMRSMMMGLPAEGYEIITADYKEVYRDSFFSMKLSKIYRSPLLHGYILEVENLASFPVLLRLQEIDFSGMVAISADAEYIQPRPRKASEVTREGFRTTVYIVARPQTSLY